MSKLIEIHILKSHPAACLNRDGLNQPKNLYFGGVERSRISSSASKLACRLACKAEFPIVFGGERTRLTVEPLIEMFQKQGVSLAKATSGAISISQALGTVDTYGEPQTVVFLQPSALQKIVDATLTLVNSLPETSVDASAETSAETSVESSEKIENNKPKAKSEKAKSEKAKSKKAKAKKAKSTKIDKDIEKIVKSVLKQTGFNDAFDIPLGGRMMASAPELTVEGAVAYSQVFTTHEIEPQFDFYTAMEERQKQSKVGCASMGHNGFTSGTFYGYVAVNLSMLADSEHLGGEPMTIQDRQLAVATFVKNAIISNPSAKKNSFNASTLPEYVLVIVREGSLINNGDAFENPIQANGEGFMKPSIQRLEDFWTNKKERYSLKNILQEIRISETNLDTLIADISKHVI